MAALILTKWLRFSQILGQITIIQLLENALRRTHHDICDAPTERTEHESNQGKQQSNPKWGISHKITAMYSSTIEVTDWRMISDQRCTQGMWQLNVTSDPALDPKPEEIH